MKRKRLPSWQAQLSVSASQARRQLCTALISRCACIAMEKESGDNHDILTILSVGAGDGWLEAAIAASLQQEQPGGAKAHRQRVRVTVVEPSAALARAAALALAAHGALDSTAADVLCCTFNAALPLLGSRTFDVVLLSHSLYFLGVDDAARACALRSAQRLVVAADHGRLLVVLASRVGVGELCIALEGEKAIERTRIAIAIANAANETASTAATDEACTSAAASSSSSSSSSSLPLPCSTLAAAATAAALEPWAEAPFVAESVTTPAFPLPLRVEKWRTALDCRGAQDNVGDAQSTLAFLLDLDDGLATLKALPRRVQSALTDLFLDTLTSDDVLNDVSVLLEWKHAVVEATTVGEAAGETAGEESGDSTLARDRGTVERN